MIGKTTGIIEKRVSNKLPLGHETGIKRSEHSIHSKSVVVLPDKSKQNIRVDHRIVFCEKKTVRLTEPHNQKLQLIDSR